jgi:hypothetical protein
MKIVCLTVALLLSGCAAEQYTYLEPIRSETIIQRSLYAVAVPASSVMDTREWERFAKNGKPDDLVLKYSEGLVLPSYAASIEVKRQVQKVGNMNELKSYVAKDPEYRNALEFHKPQSQLLCVRPAVFIDAAPEKVHGFFQHALLCIDSKTHNYYQLKVSYMTTRKGNVPPDELARMADHFFASFRVDS